MAEASTPRQETRIGPGTNVGGRYSLMRLLGQGGMGTVWRAIGLSGELVAIKILHWATGEGKRRFAREARVLMTLSHPNIVPVLEVHEVGPTAVPAIVMPLLQGQSLAERLQDCGRLSVDELLRYLERISGALAFSHAKGVVHRDIKPANIFLEEGGELRVLDFGLAKISDDADEGLQTSGQVRTHTEAVMGTPFYMSPEQSQTSRVDAKTDIWSLGVLAYECLTSQLPFMRESKRGSAVFDVMDAMGGLAASKTPLIVDDSRVAELVGVMLAYSPKHRPTAAEVHGIVRELRAHRRAVPELSAMAKAASGQSLLPPASTAAPPPARRDAATQHRIAFIVLSAFLGAAIAVAAFLFARG